MVVVCAASCATSSSATLKTTGAQAESGFSTDIVSIDGKEPSWVSGDIDPGRHVVEVVGTSKAIGVNGNGSALPATLLFGPAGALGATLAADTGHSGRIKVCFIARPGHSYEARTFIEGGAWQVQIVDQSTTYDVKSPCKRAANK